MDQRFGGPTTEPEMSMNKTAKEIVAANNTTEMVDVAVEMNRQIAALTKELDVLKAAIREKGLVEVAKSGDNNVTLTGTVGTAQVVAVKAAAKAKKGVDLLATEGNLPADVWGSLFTKVVKVEIADDFEEKVAGLTTAQKAVVNNLVEMVAQTPRVTLK